MYLHDHSISSLADVRQIGVPRTNIKYLSPDHLWVWLATADSIVGWHNIHSTLWASQRLQLGEKYIMGRVTCRRITVNCHTRTADSLVKVVWRKARGTQDVSCSKANLRVCERVCMYCWSVCARARYAKHSRM